MGKLTLKYYQDPGHGWVRISKAKLKALDLENKISRYSYMRNNWVYLEEDLDLGLLYRACDKLGIEIQLIEYHTNNRSRIRSYDSYKNHDGFMQYLKDNNKLIITKIGF